MQQAPTATSSDMVRPAIAKIRVPVRNASGRGIYPLLGNLSDGATPLQKPKGDGTSFEQTRSADCIAQMNKVCAEQKIDLLL